MSALSPKPRAVSAAITVVVAVTTIGAAVFGAAPADAAAKAKVIDGPDLSSNNYSVVRTGACSPATNWNAVKKAGKDFGIAKATEGTTYDNPCFSQDYNGAKSAGLVRGSYHFADPALPVYSTAVAQAKHYAAALGSVKTTKTLPPVLDFETTGGLSRPQLITWGQDFLLELRSLTGRTPMLYTYPSFYASTLADPAAVSRFPLWMASFGAAHAPTADIWQYSDDATIKGIHGRVDESKFVGALGRSWSTLTNGTLASPFPDAGPGAPVSVRGSAVDGGATVSWLPGDAGSSHVTGYTVTAKPGGKKLSVGGTTFSAHFTGLTIGQTYTFTVRAKNAVDTSAASVASNPVTVVIPTGLTASAASSTHAGTTLPVSASVKRRDTNKPLSGARVLIYRLDGSHWVQARKLTTNSKGVVTSTLTPTATHEYEFVYPGASGFARAQAYATVTVRPKVTAGFATKTVRLHQVDTLSGSVSPFVTHQRVTKQRLQSNGTWKTVSTGKVWKSGKYSFRVDPAKRGSYTFRVVVSKAGGRARGYSPRRTITVD